MLSQTMRQLAVIEVPGDVGPVTVNQQYNGMVTVEYMNGGHAHHPAFDSYASALGSVLDMVGDADAGGTRDVVDAHDGRGVL